MELNLGRRLSGGFRRRWDKTIRMDLIEIGINARNSVDSAQDRDYWRALVNAASIILVPYFVELVKPRKDYFRKPKA